MMKLPADCESGTATMSCPALKPANFRTEGLSMGLFDSLKQSAEAAFKKEASKVIGNAAANLSQAVAKGRNHTETFTFQALPKNAKELQALPEASLDSAFKTTALTIAALCRYEESSEDTFEMLNVLKGPEPLSEREKQFIADRLKGKIYKVFSYFQGTSPENNYQPAQPYKITVSENPYSFETENWATLYVTSSGADSPRPVKLRKKPSTGQWFLNDIQCLSDIRIPKEADPWA